MSAIEAHDVYGGLRPRMRRDHRPDLRLISDATPEQVAEVTEKAAEETGADASVLVGVLLGMLTASLPKGTWEGPVAETEAAQAREWLRVAGLLKTNLQDFIDDLKASVPVEMTSSDVRKQWAKSLDRVHAGDETIFITQHGARIAALVPPYVAEQYDADQAWFWTPEWQAGERQADAELAAGKGEVFHSPEEFLAALRKIEPAGE